jgi:hypothetical protein
MSRLLKDPVQRGGAVGGGKSKPLGRRQSNLARCISRSFRKHPFPLFHSIDQGAGRGVDHLLVGICFLTLREDRDLVFGVIVVFVHPLAGFSLSQDRLDAILDRMT